MSVIPILTNDPWVVYPTHIKGGLMSSSIDWNLLRYMYEVHGVSEEDIADENDTSLSMVEYVRDTQGWRRSKLAESANDWKQLEDHRDDDMMADVQQRMSAISLLQQVANNPRLHAFETALITRAIDTTQYLDPANPQTADLLCKLGALLEKLKSTNPALKALSKKSEEAGSGSGSIKIQIVTGYAQNRQDTIEVTAPVQIGSNNEDCLPVPQETY